MAWENYPVPQSEKGAVRNAGEWWMDDSEETLELRWPLSVKVFGRMRREEAQIASVVRAVKMPILRTRRRLNASGCRPKVARAVAEDLGLPIVGEEDVAPRRTRDRFNFAEHARLALTAFDFGHSVFEQVYRPEAGLFRLRKLGWRPPRTISRWDEAADGGLVAIEQNLLTGRPARLEVGRLVVYCHEREESWIGQSLLRPAYKYWILKDQLLRGNQTTIIRNGMGVPTVTAPALPEHLQSDPAAAAEWMQAQIEAGLVVTKQLRGGDNTGVSLANGGQLAMKGVEGKLPDALPTIRYHDEQMARSVLAHVLNLGGADSTSSYALGSTLNGLFTESQQGMSDWFDGVVNEHIIEDLVDVNFGPDEPAPRLVSDRIGSELSAEALRSLVDAGVITPDDRLENFTREAYGLPVADKSTARTTPAAPAAPQEATDAA